MKNTHAQTIPATAVALKGRDTLIYEAWSPGESLAEEGLFKGFGLAFGHILSDRTCFRYADLIDHPRLDSDLLDDFDILEEELTVLIGKLALHHIIITDVDIFSTRQIYDFIYEVVMEDEVQLREYPDNLIYYSIAKYLEQKDPVYFETADLLRILFSEDWRCLHTYTGGLVEIDGISYNANKIQELRAKMRKEFTACSLHSMNLKERFELGDVMVEIIDLDLCYFGTGHLRRWLEEVRIESVPGYPNRVIRRINGLLMR